MDQLVLITVKNKALANALNNVLKISGRKLKSPIINIRAYKNFIELSVQGAMNKISAEVIGEADISVPSKLILAYLQTSSMDEITFKFTKGQLECGSSIYNTSAIDLTPINTYSNSDIAINYTRPTLIRFALNHSENEIEQKGLSNVIRLAKNNLKNTIQQAAEILKDYEITFDEIEDFVLSKIKKNHISK